MYKTAVYTGLRLGEIASLRPCHLELARKPFPRWKSPGGDQERPAGPAAARAGFADELAAWIGNKGAG